MMIDYNDDEKLNNINQSQPPSKQCGDPACAHKSPASSRRPRRQCWILRFAPHIGHHALPGWWPLHEDHGAHPCQSRPRWQRPPCHQPTSKIILRMDSVDLNACLQRVFCFHAELPVAIIQGAATLLSWSFTFNINVQIIENYIQLKYGFNDICCAQHRSQCIFLMENLLVHIFLQFSRYFFCNHWSFFQSWSIHKFKFHIQPDSFLPLCLQCAPPTFDRSNSFSSSQKLPRHCFIWRWVFMMIVKTKL